MSSISSRKLRKRRVSKTGEGRGLKFTRFNVGLQLQQCQGMGQVVEPCGVGLRGSSIVYICTSISTTLRSL